MPRLAAAAVLVISLALTASHSRAQVREARAAAQASASITGAVMSSDPEPRPVRKVRVTCVGGDTSVTTITDDRGRFAFPDLAAGRYTITGTKEGWVTAAYGAKRPLRPGSAIPLATGQHESITLRMLHGAVITGVLLDYSNQPAANTAVHALRYEMRNGTRRLSPAAAGETDDRGVYRIYGLAPGDYFVGAAARSHASGTGSGELRLLDDRLRSERTVAFASTYFPGTTTATQASTVTLRPGEERDGIDFVLQLVPTARVEGTVTNPDGSSAIPGTEVNLNASVDTAFPGTNLAGFRSTRTGPGGTFTFADVSPGVYTVIARGGPPLTWASSEIAVDGENIAGIALGLQPAMVMMGYVRFDATRLTPPADPGGVRLALQPVDAQSAVSLSPSSAITDRSWRFEIAGIVPGTYTVSMGLPGLGRPGNWFLRSAVINGQETLDAPISIRAGDQLREVVITLSDHPARLSGAVQNAAGGAPNEFTVILFAADRTFWSPRSRRIFAARPSADGAFTFDGLAPGDYLLAAIDDVEPGEWLDPALLQRLVPTAMKLSLAEGEQKTQDIRLGGG